MRGVFASLGIETIDSDGVGHLVLTPGGSAFPQVARRWPEVVRDGQIDRTALAAVVFANPEELATLESITHPHIFDTIRHRVEEVAGSVVVEIPVLRHGLGEDWCRIVVDSRDETRLERAMNRGMSKKDAQHRIARQPSRREWLAAADLVIPNHGSENELEEAAIQLIAQLSPE